MISVSWSTWTITIKVYEVCTGSTIAVASLSLGYCWSQLFLLSVKRCDVQIGQLLVKGRVEEISAQNVRRCHKPTLLTYSIKALNETQICWKQILNSHLSWGIHFPLSFAWCLQGAFLSFTLYTNVKRNVYIKWCSRCLVGRKMSKGPHSIFTETVSFKLAICIQRKFSIYWENC